jgi:D-tyrosyl-tRNA(Tyr) deacylase
MRAVIQRVTQANVTIDSKSFSSIKSGLLILLAVEENDSNEDITWLTSKIINLRIFNDKNEKLNLDIKQINGEMLVVSQFTLYASTVKGNRPSFIKAAKPELALHLYEKFIETMQGMLPSKIKTGKFAANMQITSTNDGPVTIIIDSKLKE